MGFPLEGRRWDFHWREGGGVLLAGGGVLLAGGMGIKRAKGEAPVVRPCSVVSTIYGT